MSWMRSLFLALVSAAAVAALAAVSPAPVYAQSAGCWQCNDCGGGCGECHFCDGNGIGGECRDECDEPVPAVCQLSGDMCLGQGLLEEIELETGAYVLGKRLAPDAVALLDCDGTVVDVLYTTDGLERRRRAATHFGLRIAAAEAGGYTPGTEESGTEASTG